MLSKSILIIVGLSFTTLGIDGKRAEKIYHGNDVQDDEYPFMASFLINDKHTCGASIIGEKHLVTAAHCVAAVPAHAIQTAKVRTGSIHCESGGRLHGVRRIIYHRQYVIGDSTSPNDIAIIELKAPIQLDDHQKVITLPSQPIDPGVTATAIGWGHTEYRKDTNPTLRQVPLRTMDPWSCQNHIPYRLFTHQICGVGFGRQGVCIGDSGGPLIWNRQLIGVVSYGVPCARGNPDVFTSIHHYIDWINTVIGP